MKRTIKLALGFIALSVVTLVLFLFVFPIQFLYVTTNLFITPMSMDSARAEYHGHFARRIEVNCERRVLNGPAICSVEFFKSPDASVTSAFAYRIEHAAYRTSESANSADPHIALLMTGVRTVNTLCKAKLGEARGLDGAYALKDFFKPDDRRRTIRVSVLKDKQGACTTITDRGGDAFAPAEAGDLTEDPERRRTALVGLVEKAFVFQPNPDWHLLKQVCRTSCPPYFSVNFDRAPGTKELHIVATSVYPDGEKKKIVISPTAKSTILLLVTYNAVQWDIEARPGAKLERVVLVGSPKASAHLKGTTVVPERWLDTRLVQQIGMFTTNLNSSSFAMHADEAEQKLKARYSSYQNFSQGDTGELRVPIDISSSDLGLIQQETSALLARAHRPNPVDLPRSELSFDKRKIVTDDGRTFTLSDQGLMVDAKGSQSPQVFKPPLDPPKWNWLGDLAYDPTSGNLLLVTRSPEDSHFILSLTTKAWTAVSAIEGAVESIVYHRRSRRLFAVQRVLGRPGAKFVELSQDLKVASEPETRLAPNYDGVNSALGTLPKLIEFGDHVLIEPRRDNKGEYWVGFNTKTNAVELLPGR